MVHCRDAEDIVDDAADIAAVTATSSLEVMTHFLVSSLLLLLVVSCELNTL